MSNPATQQILCPGCETEIIPLVNIGCSNCHRCPLCGRKVPRDVEKCVCGPSAHADWAEQLLSNNGIPDEEIPREKLRMVIRKRLATKKAIVAGILGGVMVTTVRFGKALGPVWLQVLLCSLIFLVITYGNEKLFKSIEDNCIAKESENDRREVD